MIGTERSLDERYESVHRAILEGPSRDLQKLVDSGLAWRARGSVGRMVQAALRSGAAVLPPHQVKDYYGATVPSYHDVEDEVGSPGSVANAETYDPEGE